MQSISRGRISIIESQIEEREALEEKIWSGEINYLGKKMNENKVIYEADESDRAYCRVFSKRIST